MLSRLPEAAAPRPIPFRPLFPASRVPGLVLQDNGADDMTISANGTVTFATAVANNGAFVVTVKTQPSTPSQTCVITGGSGAATANVMVQVNCSTGTFTVGGQVTGLTGTGLVLQNNGGDNLTVNQTGTFTTPLPPMATASSTTCGVIYHFQTRRGLESDGHRRALMDATNPGP